MKTRFSSRMWFAALACILGSMTAWAAEPPDTDRKEVIVATEELFAAIAAHDGEKLRELILPEAVIVNTDESKGPSFVRVRTAQAFIEGIVKSTEALLERMWDPQVQVDGNIAALWAAYDFHRGGKLSHCGYDALQFIRQDGRWRISAISYTLYPAAKCPAR